MRVEAGGYIADAVRRHRDRVAVSSNQGDQTFEELNSTANRIGSGLRKIGALVGDRVGVLSYNRIEVLQAWIGLEKLGLVRVVLHSHFELATHAATLREVGAKVLMFDTRFAAAIEAQKELFTSIRLFVALGQNVPPWSIPLSQIIDQGSSQEPVLDVDEDSPCFIQLTTGTTGRPKPWIVTHRSWRAVIEGNFEHLDTFQSDSQVLNTGDVNLHFHALQWASGFQTLMPYLLRGARTVLVDDECFDARSLVDELVATHCTGMFVPGPLLTPLLDEVEARGGIAHHLKRLMIFFATPELLRRTSQVLGDVWCHGFGSTEQGAPTTRLTAEEAREKPTRLESVGRSISPFYELAIMGQNGIRLSATEVGEIVVRSPMCTSSYWGNTNSDSFFDGGWFRPHDVGYMDQDGFLYFLDRSKDQIRTERGVVYPHVIEAALLRHEAVANCGVVGLGNDVAHTIVAAVLLKKGVNPSPEIENALLCLAQSELTDTQQAQRVCFVSELPTVLGGAKVQRGVLRSQLLERGTL